MTKTFEDRIYSEGIVDTRNYRYALKEKEDHHEIIRLPICWLDTTRAIDGWESVREIN